MIHFDQLDQPDWTYRAAYMTERHGVTVEEANEAITDVDALVFDPDPKSRSGTSIRVIGYSHTAVHVITVILVRRDGGGWWGANGWRSNATERHAYLKHQEGIWTDG